jgi:uncharacterized protein YdiU (UPF0061 family)
MFTWDPDKIPILQLGSDFYDPVKAAVFPQEKLRYWNSEVPVQPEKQHFINFSPLSNNLTEPLALRYHGHQFQHYNPDLGDGRGFLFAQVKVNQQWYDFGTKGSGQTPYSRAGDGRLTLKGAFRESLATELLQSLGVNTSKTMCFFETGEELSRHDEPSPTRAAVLTRFSLGHIRIGTFQRLAFFSQHQNIKKLISYCVFFYYPELLKSGNEGATLAAEFFSAVVERNAKLVAQVMIGGFVHGVLNTDNINISGELFDYGPYRFLPYYDPSFTAAYFDQQGLYCYGRQPASFVWALNQLGLCLKEAYPELDVDKILSSFSEKFNSSLHEGFLNRLNLKVRSPEEVSRLISAFFKMLQETNVHFEQAFFDFYGGRVLSHEKTRNYETTGKLFLEELKKFEIKDATKAAHPYFKEEIPVTLLIDEIETLWKPIAQNDDWSFYEEKLRKIREIRGLF